MDSIHEHLIEPVFRSDVIEEEFSIPMTIENARFLRDILIKLIAAYENKHSSLEGK